MSPYALENEFAFRNLALVTVAVFFRIITDREVWQTSVVLSYAWYITLVLCIWQSAHVRGKEEQMCVHRK